MAAFGREKMDMEIKKMRNVLSQKIKQCDQPSQEISQETRHFCDYYKKDERQMIDEVRDIQRTKSLAIISRLNQSSMKPW